MLDAATKQRINSARQVLVGKIPDPKSQVEQITTALIYKFMDDMDRENEQIDRKATFLIGDLADFMWGKLMSRRISGDERWNLYSRAMQVFATAPQIPNLFRAIFKSAFLPYRDPQTLNLFLKEIDGFTYDHSERLGDAFEYLLSVLGSQGDAGQFRTPRHLIDFMVEVVAPQKNERILDPACGTAGFLISAYKYIQKQNSSNFDAQSAPLSFAHADGDAVSEVAIQSSNSYLADRLSPAERLRLAKNICGYDIAPEMTRLSLVNMYLHGFTTPTIHEYDTLTFDDKWEDEYDVILANPPFMTPKGGIRPHTRFSVQANRSEVLFVDYIAEHLTINGRAAIIVPEGIIFQSSNAYKSLRKNLIHNWGLYAVVSLPGGVFNPYSGVKTSILFLDRQLAKRSAQILFVAVENDGFDLGAQRRHIDKNDLPPAFTALAHWKKKQTVNDERIAHAVDKAQIGADGAYNLTAIRYRTPVDYRNAKWPMVELGEVLDYEQPTNYIVDSVNYKDEYKIPVLTAGKSFILGYTNEKNGIFPNAKLPVIIFDDFTTAIQLVDFPFKVKSSAMKILLANDNAHVKFIYYMMQFIKFDAGRHKRYWIAEYSKIKIPLPPLKAQEEIVAELDGYQNVIDGAKQVVASWKPHIKINPDWKMVELGEVCESILSGGTPSTKNKAYWKGSIPWITSADIVNIKIAKPRKYITKESIKKSATNLIKKGNIIVVTRVGLGKLFKNDFDVCISQDSQGLILKDGIVCADYLVRMLQREVENFKKVSQGSTIQGVTKRQLSEIKIPLPPLKVQQEIVAEITAEQKAVAECKTLIDLHERKIKERIDDVWGKVI